MLNPKLKPGDRVRLLYMDGETSLPPNTWGTVKSVYNAFGSDDYAVVWDDGDKDNVGEKVSQLNLITDTDAWDFGGREKKSIEEKWLKKKKITENKDMELFMKNSDILPYFKIDGKNYLLDLVRFLKLVRKSGIVNMYQSAPFLYMGPEYIDRHYGDGIMTDRESFDEMLEHADDARYKLIMITMNLVNDKYKIDSNEYDDEDSYEDSKMLKLANRHIKDLAQRVLQFYMFSF